MLGGEDLLARVYEAVRSSSSPRGSTHLNATLLVTFDEHGGTYDHVPPGPAPAPTEGAPAGQLGFRFDRLGVRGPTIAVSPGSPSARSSPGTLEHLRPGHAPRAGNEACSPGRPQRMCEQLADDFDLAVG
ncbi:alkaline phosphatase family protein [Streptomyces sp. NPDC060049]|uniref:alkaline phosphatase family protein n=1 Tax=Streptomyces sp. NPDC060049 TaxID=3347046 RepID=UPI003682E4C3